MRWIKKHFQTMQQRCVSLYIMKTHSKTVGSMQWHDKNLFPNFFTPSYCVAIMHFSGDKWHQNLVREKNFFLIKISQKYLNTRWFSFISIINITLKYAMILFPFSNFRVKKLVQFIIFFTLIMLFPCKYRHHRQHIKEKSK